MITEELKNRGLYGLIFVLILWISSSYSKISFSVLFVILGLACLYEMWKLRKGKSKIIAFLYILIPFYLIHFFSFYDLHLDSSVFNPDLILFIFILTWTFDTFAYIFGTNFGRHKILPNISPKKSWEGFIGGLIFTLIVAYFSQSYFELIIEPIIIALILPFTATSGDLIESKYKRQAGVKDSGNIIPGHGGILDRMDAFMITIPVIYLYITI